MHRDTPIPELTFPSIEYSKGSIPMDFKVLLYHGGAGAHSREFKSLVDTGQLGKPKFERLELVKAIHAVALGKLLAGGSIHTAKSIYTYFRRFFKWAEQEGHPLTLTTIQTTYLHWTDSLIYRQRVARQISAIQAYSMSAHVGSNLDEVLDRLTPMLLLTRVRSPHKRKTARGIQADKQNLKDAFSFGHLLQDICDGLTVDAIFKSRLPLELPLRAGGTLIQWSGYRNPKAVTRWKSTNLETSQLQYWARQSLQNFADWECEGSLKTRHPLANLRCEAELLMLIGQTGLNLAQAHTLRLRNFFYVSHLDGYQVKDRKYRKGGDVIFEIFSDYKPHFERYLDWRRQIFPNSERLFPFVHTNGGSENIAPTFHRLRKECNQLGVAFVSPQALRNTRINWLLRRSGDSDLTASMAQHTRETLIRVYERPSQQTAMCEVMRFWSKHDPTLSKTQPPAPGYCDGQPKSVAGIPRNAPIPDCIRPSGCLWCAHHRDIDSEDYVWSLACFRHLKVIELSKLPPQQGAFDISPAEHAINRIGEKLRWFYGSNAKRRGWVEEAKARVEEGAYHPHWRWLIQKMEGAASNET